MTCRNLQIKYSMAKNVEISTFEYLTSIKRKVKSPEISNHRRVALLNVRIYTYRRMAENGFAPPPPREFCRHILSCRELKAESFKKCLHSVLRGVSL